MTQERFDRIFNRVTDYLLNLSLGITLLITYALA